MFCCLCIDGDSELVDVITGGDGMSSITPIIKMVANFLHIDIKTDNNSPIRICLYCQGVLNNFEKFCLRISDKQNTLKQWINDPLEIEIIEEIGFDAGKEDNIEMSYYLDDTQQRTAYEEFEQESNDRPYTQDSQEDSQEDQPVERICMAKQCESNEYVRTHVALTCDICQETADTFNHLKLHYKNVHGQIGFAKCCNRRFYRRYLLIDHMKIHEDPDFFKCKTCGKLLHSRKGYNQHMDRLHTAKAEELPFECLS